MKVVVSRATDTPPELRRSRDGEAQDCGLVVYNAVWFRVCRRVGGIPASVIRVEGKLILKALFQSLQSNAV